MTAAPTPDPSMKILRIFEKSAFIFCILILMIFIVLEAIEVIVFLYQGIVHPSEENFLLSVPERKKMVSSFLNILIALEMMETIRVYIQKHVVRPDMIIVVGLVAVVRKLLTLDISHTDPLIDLGLGVLILALSVGYFLVRKKGWHISLKKKTDAAEEK